MADNATKILANIKSLQRNWESRQNQFTKWYDLLRQVNDLAQDKMESVISSDPRASFEMAAWLLEPKSGSFRVDSSQLGDGDRQALGSIEAYCDRQLLEANRRTRGTLFGRFITRLVRYTLATGWLSVVSVPTRQGWVLTAWHPATVYPDYDSDGHLIALGRQYSCTAKEANSKVASESWMAPSSPFTYNKQTISHLFTEEDYGVRHQVVIGANHIARDIVLPLKRIPIYCVPLGGLPDDGSLGGSNTWQGEVGQSLLAPILHVQKNYDKMLTYFQQILRDTANPRWYEKARGGRSILSPDKLFDRGFVATMEPGEDAGTFPMPGIPPEMRGHQFELRGQIQRSLFSDITLGNIQQAISAVLMSQVTAAAQRVLYPFQQGIRDLLGDIATTNIDLMRVHGMDLGRTPLPSLEEKELFLDYKYEIQIPGDFMNRITAARMVNPEFRLAKSTIMDLLFPEITNALVEQGQLNAEDAFQQPMVRNLILSQEVSRAAQLAIEAGDTEFAGELQKVSDMMMLSAGQAAGGVANTGSTLPDTLDQLLSVGGQG